MQVRIPDALVKPLKLFAVNHDLSVPRSVEILLKTNPALKIPPTKRK